MIRKAIILILAIFVHRAESVLADVPALEAEHLRKMTLDQLLDITVRSPSSLTAISNELAPASITTITQQQITTSGARNLDELLEIYVPGFIAMHKSRNGTQIGIRGIISDRNNKLLLLVNGKKMNDNSALGVTSERFLSMLGDIEKIEVVRGPGSVVYGSGAIAGVISITTFRAGTFEGLDVNVRQGAIEEFTTAEMRYGKRINDETGVFFYAGLDNYRGADKDDSPFVFSNSFETFDGEQVVGGGPVPFPVEDNHRSYRNQPRYKLHGEVKHENVSVWARFTRGGERTESTQAVYELEEFADAYANENGYQQLTFGLEYEQRISESFRINYLSSFDVDDMEIGIPGRRETAPDATVDGWREDEFYFRSLAHYQGLEHHKLSFGIEYSHQEFGKNSPGYPNTPAFIVPSLQDADGTMRWADDSYAFLFEDQFQPVHWATIFLGARMDDSRFIDPEISPRLAITFQPDDKNIFKAIYNRAIRQTDEAEARAQALLEGDDGDVEKINFYEGQYIRKFDNDFSLTTSAYYGDYDVVAFTFNTRKSQLLGELEYYGIEVEADYSPTWGRFLVSHNFTRHLDFDLASPDISMQNVSASPYGFGDDLANWYNHITKVIAEYRPIEDLTLHSSLRIFWELPGGQDLAEYNAATFNTPNLPVTDGSDRAFEESIFLNLGTTYKATENLTLGLHGFNVLGWFEKDLNKRNSFQRTSQYRSEAAAVALSVTYAFE